MRKNVNFLDSVSFISENQAEYTILTDLYLECQNMIFLFELSELNNVKFQYSNIVKSINENYKSFDLRKFELESNGSVRYEVLKSESGSSLKDEELFNLAIDISKKNNSYILVRAARALVLIYKGQFDLEFKNIFADKKALIDMNNMKRDINELELVFENFHSERKHKGCDYVEDDKVKDSVSEQQLRNGLISFLEKVTKLHIVPELCTSKHEDEESVDIGVIDSNNEVAIIEVKFFVKQGFFKSPDKKAYSKSRFKDGYEQLNRYCIHLNKENYKLHSAFLYMFYAHSESYEKIYENSKQYYAEFVKLSECSNDFLHHYKSTICDNIVDVKS
ncbi:MAG: hypothetical protein EOM28_11270 [Clostridia bacterium]|nr:hypothetical protein [Clostridia bacterium]